MYTTIEHLNKEFLLSRQSTPIIAISPIKNRVVKSIQQAQYSTISLNELLSSRLIGYPAQDRPSMVENVFSQIMTPYQNVFVTNIEMLFDPRYPVDVLKLFCYHARVSNIVILWPGNLKDNHLIYGQSSDPDYHSYDLSNYQIQVLA